MMGWHPLSSRLPLSYTTIIIMVLMCGTEACFQEEKAALLKYKEFLMMSPNNTKSVESPLSSWVDSDPNSDCCGWERVTCDPASGHVTSLSLHFLYGTPPYDRFADQYVKSQCLDLLRLNFSLFVPFKELRSLDLSFNCFNDWVLTQDFAGRSAWKRLETLDLSNCAFNISIMEMLSSFTSLKTLLLRNNNLFWSFPVQELLALRNLEQLDLSGNMLESLSIVHDLKRMSSALKKLEKLDLSYNILLEKSTSIFKSFRDFKSLKNLALRSTNIYGPFPVHELSVLQNLEMLDLSGNQLTNPSTTAVFANLSKLEVLILRHSTGHLVPIQGLCKIKNLQELDLSGNNLVGTLSSFSCLKNLTSLRVLDLSNNFLRGNISTSLVAHYASLEYLILSGNYFEGTFLLSSLANYSKLKVFTLRGMYNKNFQVETENPPWFPSFQLQYLDMPNCQVNLGTRTIPTFLSYQHELRYIDLSKNNLVGSFPSWLLVNNPKLEVVLLNFNSFNGSFLLPSDEDQHILDHLYMLDISHNKIQDKLPKNLGFFFPYLNYLNASSNALDGHIPASIGEMSTLVTLDLAYNNFSGELPIDMLKGCIMLRTLILSHNRFQGQVLPAPIGMISLSMLLMDNNHFNGTLQDGLLSMQYLYLLDICNNMLSGELPGWVGNLKLEFLSASRNNFQGAIPTELCELPELNLLSLSHNRFSGIIPSCFGLSLEFIHLQNNSLTGTIPEFRAEALVSLDLGDNSLSGSIPKNINKLTILKLLLLGGNRLQGQLPTQICELKELNFLDLSRNNFTGSIPACFSNISFGNEFGYAHQHYSIDYYGDYLNGFLYFELFYFNSRYRYIDLQSYDEDDELYFIQIEMEFTTKGSSLLYTGNIVDYMSGLDLSSNQFAGKIPQQIGDLFALHALNLSHNYLDGSIPESFQRLETIESLDLSFNRLSGQVPSQLQDLNSLSVFNVSYNNLSGRAPDKGQFGTFDESSYRGNPNLYWSISNRGIATWSPPPLLAVTLNDGENNSAIDFISFCWTFAASYVMVVLMFIVILWINPYWRRLWFYFIEDCLYKCFGRVLKDAFY